jgi:fatty acid desaturase
MDPTALAQGRNEMVTTQETRAPGGRETLALPPMTERRGTVTPKRVQQAALDYAALKRTISQRGLLDKQPAYYTRRIAINLSILALSILILLTVQSFALQLLNAVLMAFALVQIAFVGHNSGHRQVGTRPWHDVAITQSVFGLLLGTSASWWVEKHNEHHGHPNVDDLDPDINFPMMAFSADQALRKQGLPRFVVAYQALLYPFMITLITLEMRWVSIKKILSGTVRHPVLEASLMAGFFVWYFGLLVIALDGWQILAFAALNHALIGIYLASVFAVNHKGMPVLERDTDMDFLRLQVVTARNVRSERYTDFFYGGLNYQVEHHLFPTMPQNKLREARTIVMEFCQTHQIPYYETGFVRSQWEVLCHLHAVGAPLRLGLTNQGAAGPS